MTALDRMNGALGGLKKEENRIATLDGLIEEADVRHLTSVPVAMRCLDVIRYAAMRGLVSGSQAMASTRAVEIWLRTVESAQVRELKKQVEELQRQLSEARETARLNLTETPVEFVLATPALAEEDEKLFGRIDDDDEPA